MPKVSLKSSLHHIAFLTSLLNQKYWDGQAYISFAWQVLEISNSNTHRIDWFLRLVCDMRSKRQQKCKRPRMGIHFWKCGNECSLRKCCSCKSRRTKFMSKYDEGWNSSGVGPITIAVNDREGHLIVPFS